jgi:hypothetical protein
MTAELPKRGRREQGICLLLPIPGGSRRFFYAPLRHQMCNVNGCAKLDATAFEWEEAKMKSVAHTGIIVLTSFVAFWLISNWSALSVAHAAPLAQAPRPMPRAIARGTQQASSLHLPALSLRHAQAASTTISVNYLPSGRRSAFGDMCQTWSVQAQSAFNYATAIWAMQVSSSVPIKINACLTELSPNTLGYSGAVSFHKDFVGGVSGYWYDAALANSLAHMDLNDKDGIDWDSDGLDGDAEIEVAINTAITWYLGTDSMVPVGQYDLATITMHEIAHGLGFMGWAYYTSGQGSWGYGTGTAGIYDRFVENGAGQKILNTGLYPNPSSALGTQMTSNNLYFNGPNARVANTGNRAKLYAPSTWQPGASYSHLDEMFNGTADALMTFSFGYQEVIHTPGPVMLGILSDLGWEQSAECFSLNTLTSPSNAGRITANPTPNCGDNKYLPLTEVTLSATPNSGYAFANWAGTGGGRTLSVNVMMNSSKDITAVFNSSSSQFVFIPMIKH